MNNSFFPSYMLRALGIGVNRLNDGDLKDRAEADTVVSDLKLFGYTLVGSRFVRTNQILVTSHFHPEGADKAVFTDGEKRQILDIPGLADMDLFDLPQGIADVLGLMIRDARVKKGLSPEPADLG